MAFLQLRDAAFALLFFLPFLCAVFHKPFTRISKIGRRPEGCPPGPKTKWLLGNLHLVPTSRRHIQFQKWAQEYGNVYSLVFGTRIIIVLSSDEVVKELLDKRSGYYSSRPKSYIRDLSTGELVFGFMEYSDPRWKLSHRLFSSVLNSSAAQSYYPYQDLESKKMLHSLLKDPNAYKNHTRRYTFSATAQIVYGFRVEEVDDWRFIGLYEYFETLSELIGKNLSLLADVYPVLQHLPDALLPSRPIAKQMNTKTLTFFRRLWDKVVEDTKNGVAADCVAKGLFGVQSIETQNGLTDDLAAYICGILLLGGSDSSSNELVAFLQAMILFPDVQTRAQEELDRVCGDKLPTKADVAELPYIRACVKEVLRWMPAAVLGVPHAVDRDDVYKGMKIPKGAAVMCNTWAINNDSKRHPNPREFNPSRYLGDDRSARESTVLTDVKERDHFLFGAGRRVCQGMDIAESSITLGIARILWAFNIGKGQASDGSPFTPDAEDLIGGVMICPAPFPASIKPRSEMHAETIEREWKNVQYVLDAETRQWTPEHFPENVKFGDIRVKRAF